MKISPPAHYAVAQDFLQVYGKTLNVQLMSKADIDRIIHLRCSQLPFCPTSLVLEYKLKGLFRGMDLMGSYFTSVGTAVHEVMQRYLCLSGRFLADYVCHECGTVHHLSTKHECCGFDTHYHEVQIDFLGIKGHIDGIFQDRNGDWWILDFKTCSVSGAAKKKTSPGVGYIEQVESYAYLLYRQYGIQVKGTMLVFLPRDNPRSPVVWTQPVDMGKFKVIHARLKHYRALHKQALAAVTARDVWALTKHRCTNQYCRYCKLSDTALKALIKQAFLSSAVALPLSELKSLERPEAKILIYHNSPYHDKAMIPVRHIENLRDRDTQVRLGRAVARKLFNLQEIHERSKKNA